MASANEAKKRDDNPNTSELHGEESFIFDASTVIMKE